MSGTLDDLYKESVRAYGVEAQLMKAAEECGELASAINKWAALALIGGVLASRED